VAKPAKNKLSVDKVEKLPAEVEIKNGMPLEHLKFRVKNGFIFQGRPRKWQDDARNH